MRKGPHEIDQRRIPEIRSPLLFSIVTVVLNDRAGLRNTMNSVERQTFADFEWIVIDGGSTDGTVELIESAECISQWTSEGDSGIYHAMNKGIAQAGGDYLVFLNAGDVFPDDEVLQRTSDLIRHSSDVDIVFGGANLVFPGRKQKYREPRDINRYIRYGLPANHQATYYSRDIIGQNRYDDECSKRWLQV